MRSLLAAFRFLTRVPLPGRPTGPEELSRAVGWFPLVGALVGLATAEVFQLASRLWAAPVSAALAVAFGLLLTGGFHEDGLTDAVDGLGGGWTRERVLEIMKDSRIGAYGAMALWCALALRWTALWSLEGKALWALPLAMAWGRWSIAALLLMLPSISQGLAKEVHKGLDRGPLLVSTLCLAAVQAAAWRWSPLPPWRAAGASLPVLLAWALYLRRRMGGHSGDLLGAGNQLVEAAALLAVMAK